MSALTDLSDIINLLTNGSAQHPNVFFDNRISSSAAVTSVAGQYSSSWLYNKSNGSRGVAPTTAAVPDRTTAGAIVKQNNAAGGKQLWLLGMNGALSASCVAILYDRLSHQGGLSGTVTTAQTTNLPTAALTRNTGGEGNEIWLEIYSQIGGTATTATISYTNQAGTSGRTTPAIAIGGTGLREAERILRVPLADGDTGVRSVESVTLAASTTTAGAFGVTIVKPIVSAINEGAGSAMYRDLISGTPSVVEIVSDACLSLAFLTTSSLAAPRGFFGLNLVEK